MNKLFGIIFMVFSFMSCQAKKDNIMLTDFTKELISMYINDVENLNAKNRKDEIIIISNTDSLHYYLSVFANNSKEYKFCREDFIGQTSYSGHLIRAFGSENSNFYSVISEIKTQKRCGDNFTEYDPSIWRICFFKDLSFCKMKTYKVTADRDISAIQSLAQKFFETSNVPVANNEIYQIAEVEIAPEFALGEDSLRHIINSNFAVKRNNMQGKVPVVVSILIDKNGKATLNNISKSSNDTEIDNEALRVAKIICQYEFVPASHRGEKVNALFPVVFLRNDIVP
ncbi:TonB family protein [Proteiniphilum sp.]|nr:TonB family protein [Proteiniphilum sp.]MEA4919206.1 TonB family protein [Proteiniphilum sp.]